MLEKLSFSNDHVIAFEAKGEVSQEDYQKHIVPTMQEAKQSNTKINFLFYLGPDFEGFTAGAAWEDIKLGMQHFYAFDKIAVVSDKNYIRTMTGMFAPLMPCTVETFRNDHFDQAKAWITSDQTALTHELDQVSGILTIDITAPLSAGTFSSITRVVDPWIEQHGQLQAIIIHTITFPGWENLGSVFSHIEFVKNHHQHVAKVALVADGTMLELMPTLGKHFVKAQVKHFAYDDLASAKQWAAQ
ncbi:MAG: STAS/SEC14 domain-containing protein [Deltaproteobacteria bacterium]|nr:STAS/SEC14 domain-containing protein [Deltaproteobacteria bacterium]